MPAKITIEKGDITDKPVDAIVNPANTDLLLDAGIAGAILRKGGARIQEECERIGSIPLGEAVVTTAGNLRAFYVVHASVVEPGGQATADSIRNATHNTLLRTEGKAFKSLAFPALGTGEAGFPMEKCAEVMVREVLEHLKTRSSLETIYFVLFDDAARAVFEATYKKATARPPARVS
jgi:O-acetyl-ADP-ribose deacetylase